MNADGFIVAGFTLPHFFIDEAREITLLLDNGVRYMHIRKPNGSVSEIEALLHNIPSRLHGRLWLHDAVDLANSYHVAGVAVNSRSSSMPKGARMAVRGAHSIPELDAPWPYPDVPLAYQFLSPIFPSISKPGYSSDFDLKGITKALEGKSVVALGGITPAWFAELRKTGFAGAAMLGALWNENRAALQNVHSIVID